MGGRLLIEAAALPTPKIRRRVRIKRVRVRRVMSFTADDPEAWRVSFRVLSSEPRQWRRPIARRARPLIKDTRFLSPWPLAERAEALLRVFNDPSVYARRLARRLHAAPQLARTLTTCAPNLPPLVGVVAFGTVRAAAEQTRRVFDG